MSGRNDKMPGGQLTVIIRNDGPLIFAGDTPSFRSVKIALTPEQREKLALHWSGTSAGREIHESISHCFIEQEDA